MEDIFAVAPWHVWLCAQSLADSVGLSYELHKKWKLGGKQKSSKMLYIGWRTMVTGIIICHITALNILNVIWISLVEYRTLWNLEGIFFCNVRSTKVNLSAHQHECVVSGITWAKHLNMQIATDELNLMYCLPGAVQVDRMAPWVVWDHGWDFSPLFPLGLGKGKGHQ